MIFPLRKRTFQLLLIFCLSFVSFETVQAQGVAGSPYSLYGLGDFQQQGTVHNLSMGGIGVSVHSPLYGALANPAMLGRNGYTIFDAGYTLEQKTFTQGGEDQQDFGANINYFAFSFPVADKFGIAAGFRPLTSVLYRAVNYERVVKEEEAIGIPNPSPINSQLFVKQTFVGEGGVNQAYLAAGYQITDSLSVGAQISYNFGTILNESQASLDEPSEIDFEVVTDELFFSQLTFSPSVAYLLPLGNGKELSFGAKYDFQTGYGVRRERISETRNRSGNPILQDTIQIEQRDFDVTMPMGLDVGITYQKPLKYLVGVEVSWRDWSKYDNPARTGSLQDSYTVRIGGQYTPNYESFEYLARVTYRFGAYYTRTPYQPVGADGAITNINDYALTAGLSLPVTKLYSSVNLGVARGVRGTTDNGLVQEDYWRAWLGISFRARWFQRRQYY